MSGSNDALTQFMLLQARNQQRRPSAQARLAEQMMASLNNPQPIYGAGPAIARVGSGVLAGLMGGMAERSDREREDQQLQQIQDRQDKAEHRNRQELAAFLGGSPAMAQDAPQMPAQPPPPPTAAGGMYGRNAGLVAQRDAHLDAPPEQLAAASAQRAAATGVPEIAGGYRANPGVDGAFNGLAPPTGVVNAGIGGGRAAPQADAMSMYQRAVSSPNPLIRAMAPGFLAQANREDTRANRPPQIVPPGSTVLDPQTMRPVFTAPRAPEAPDEIERLIRQAGMTPGSPEAQAAARDILARRGMAPQTNVNVDNRAETALMRADTDTLKAVNEGVNQALSLRNVFDRAGQALRTAPEGQGAQLAPFLGQAARTLGMDIPGTTEAEVLRSITNQLASLQRIPGSGATTDTDMRLFLQSVPRLGNTRDGNMALLDMGRRLAERRIEEARIWRQHVGQPDLIDRLNALPPVFRDEERAMLAGATTQSAPGVAGPGGMTLQPPPAPTAELPIVTSPADAMRLPPGTRFRTSPNGPIREVPRQ